MADLTIYTDASLCRSSIAAWAAVWQTDEYEIGCGGLLTGGDPICSDIAEIIAIGMAIDVAVRAGDVIPRGRIVVYTDSATAIRCVNAGTGGKTRNRKARHLYETRDKAVQRVRDVIAGHMLDVELKKVRAHVKQDSNPTAHELANREADRIARKIVRTEMNRRKGRSVA